MSKRRRTKPIDETRKFINQNKDPPDFFVDRFEEKEETLEEEEEESEDEKEIEFEEEDEELEQHAENEAFSGQPPRTMNMSYRKNQNEES
ncbi:uncharacterized protein LOC111100626 isoform X2 [Crassostrea virginica]